MTLSEGISVERGRARWVKRLLITGIVIDSFAILSASAQYRLLACAAAGVRITESEDAANAARQRLSGVSQALAFSVTAVWWLMWFHRAYGNLRLMGTKEADHSPGWAVGYWFVPVMNLFRPHQLTKELWLRSKTLNTLESLPPVPIITLWWYLYVLSGLLGSTQFRWSLRAHDISAFQELTILSIVNDGVGIVAAALAVAIVTRIDAFQRDAGSSVAEPLSPAGGSNR
jgi:hypothetical protein